MNLDAYWNQLDASTDSAATLNQYRVSDEESANWLVRKVVEARAYRVRVQQWADRELHRASEDEKRLLFLFGAQLKTWTTMEITRRGGRRKSLDLPAGKVGFKRMGPKLIIEDAEAVLCWAKSACPTAVVIKQRISTEAINEHLRRTGEMPHKGVQITPGYDMLFIR